MTREDVDRWLADYVEAWMTYDRDKIEALFADDIAYRYHPWEDPIEGRDEVIKAWVAEGDHPEAGTRDEPGPYEASYRVYAWDGDAAVATGTSSYREEAEGPIA